jgi:CRISPR/Cas system CSM-associated protein Csm2 small subunit
MRKKVSSKKCTSKSLTARKTMLRSGHRHKDKKEERMSKIEQAVVRLNDDGYNARQLADIFVMTTPQMRRLLRRAKAKDRKCMERLVNAIFGAGR